MSSDSNPDDLQTKATSLRQKQLALREKLRDAITSREPLDMIRELKSSLRSLGLELRAVDDQVRET